MKMKKYRNAVFVAVYAISDGKIEYVILKRKLHWKGWEFPKGGMKFFEIKRNAVRRETREETGLRILKIKKFNISGKYEYNKKFKDRPEIIGQTYFLFAVRVKKGKIKIDRKEHSEGRWMTFEEAIKKLTWPNQRKCLKIVNDWLQKTPNRFLL